jgi:DNA-binding IclR family transcriptional regulator
MSDSGLPSGGVRSVLNALRILEAVAESQPVALAQLSRRLGLPKTTVHRGVQTLYEAGWIRPAGTEVMRWRLTAKAMTIALEAASSSGLREAALAEMRDIRDATGETVHLGVGQDDHLVIIGRVDGTRSLRAYIPVGTRAPLIASASGRAWLSALPDADVEALLERGITRYTDDTITDVDEVRRKIKLARERGFAVNEGEWREAIAAIGTVILSPDGRPLATMALSMPLARYREMDVSETAALLQTAARRTADLAAAESDGGWEM